MQTFDIKLKKIHPASVNRFDGDISLVRFDCWNQSDDTTEVWSDNQSQLQSWHETIYTQTMQKIDIMSILRRCKN